MNIALLILLSFASWNPLHQDRPKDSAAPSDPDVLALVEYLTDEDSEIPLQTRIDSLFFWLNPLDNVNDRGTLEWVLGEFTQYAEGRLTPFQAAALKLAQSDVELSLDEFERCLEHLDGVDWSRYALEGDEKAHLDGLVAMHRGSCLRALRRSAESMEEMLSALVNLNKTATATPFAKSRVLTVLANIHYELGRYNEAIEYDLEGLVHARQTGQSGLIIPIQINLASSYRALDSLSLALDTYSEVLELAEQEQNDYLNARMSMNMGNLLVDIGQYDTAIDYLTRAYTLSNEIGIPLGAVLGLANLGNAYLESGQYADALSYTLEALEQSKDGGYASVESVILKNLSKIQQALGNYEESLRYLQAHNELSDSLDNVRQEETILELREAYQADLREQEIDLTSARLEQQTRANRFMAIALLSSTGLFGLSLLFFFQYQRRLKKTFELRLLEIKRRPHMIDLSSVDSSPEEDEETTRFRPLYQQIQQAMVQDHLFADPGLTLGRVARAVASNEKYVSLAIRQVTEMKFNDYINMHRIQFAEKLILEKLGRITPAEVMDQSGFNSKSTFYTAFKSFTDLTPGQFIRMVKEKKATTSIEED